MDWKNFKGAEEVKNLEGHVTDELKKYVRMANDFGFYAESIHSVDIDTLDVVEERCEEIQRKYNKAVFFVGKLVFEEENLFTRVPPQPDGLQHPAHPAVQGHPLDRPAHPGHQDGQIRTGSNLHFYSFPADLGEKRIEKTEKVEV